VPYQHTAASPQGKQIGRVDETISKAHPRRASRVERWLIGW